MKFVEQWKVVFRKYDINWMLLSDSAVFSFSSSHPYLQPAL